jgi:hypothetical protein
MYSVKSWITFSLKTKTRVFFEKSVPNNRHCLVCQETVIFPFIFPAFLFCALYFSLRTFAFLLVYPLYLVFVFIAFSFRNSSLSGILFYFFTFFCVLLFLSSKTFTALLNTSECKTYRSISRSAGSRRLYFRKNFTYKTTNSTAHSDSSLELPMLMRSIQDPLDGHYIYRRNISSHFVPI